MTKPKQTRITPSKGKSLSIRKKGVTTHSNSAEAIQKQIKLEDEYLLNADNELDVSGVHARHRNRNTEKVIERAKRPANSRVVRKQQASRESLTLPAPVQIVEIVNRNVLNELAAVEGYPCITIYMPATTENSSEDANRMSFRNLLHKVQSAESQLGGVIKPGHQLLKDAAYWKSLTGGMAMFMSDGLCRIVKLPFPPKAQVVVNSSFQLAPLVPLLTDREYFFLLIISKKKASLFSCDHYSIKHVEISEMPNGIEDVVHLEEKDDQKLFRTGSSGAGGGANYHGMGDGKPDEKENISLYLKEVDRTLWSTILNNETSPLIIGGVDYLVNIFKGLTQYRNVWPEPLGGGHEYDDPRSLFNEAKSLIKPYFEEKTRKSLEAYQNQSATNMVSMRPVDILPAAFYGRVSKLFVQEGAELWGRFDKETSSIVIHQQLEKDDENLLDKAVLKTLLNGGEVHFLAPRDMPVHSVMAALMRY